MPRRLAMRWPLCSFKPAPSKTPYRSPRNCGPGFPRVPWRQIWKGVPLPGSVNWMRRVGPSKQFWPSTLVSTTRAPTWRPLTRAPVTPRPRKPNIEQSWSRIRAISKRCSGWPKWQLAAGTGQRSVIGWKRPSRRIPALPGPALPSPKATWS